MTKSKTTFPTRLLALCLAFVLLGGFVLQMAARAEEPEEPEEPMTVEKLLEMMGSRKYSYDGEDAAATLSVREDGYLYADRIDLKKDEITLKNIRVELDPETLQQTAENQYTVTATATARVVGQEMTAVNDAVFTVEDEIVVLLETEFEENMLSCTPETYPVSVTAPENGKLSADAEEAYEGKLVTVTAEPDEHYRLVSVTVSYPEGGETKTLDITDAKFFRMPAAEATLEAVFELQGKWSPEWLAAVEQANAFLKQERLPYADNEKRNAIHLALQDEPVPLADVAEKIAALKTAIRAYVESNALAEGYEESADMTEKIQNAENPTAIEPWLLNPEGALEILDSEPYTDGENVPAASYFETAVTMEGFDLTLSQDVELPAGEYIFTAKLRGSGTEITLSANGMDKAFTPTDGAEGTFGNGWEDYTLEFDVTEDGTVTLALAMHGEDATAWASCGDFRLARIGMIAVPETFLIFCQPAEHGTVTADREKAAEGETVTLTVEPEEGYMLASLTAEDEAGNAIEITEQSFTMPASVVTVKASFVLIPHTITVEAAEHGTLTADKTQAVDGETVNLTAEPEEGYALKDVIINGENDLVVEPAEDLKSFVMPACAVTVKPVFGKLYPITVEPSEHGTVSADREEAVEGETVTLTVEADPDYALDSLTVRCGEDEIAVDEESWTFVMPEGEVTVTASFRYAAYVTLSFDMNGHGEAIEDQQVLSGTKSTEPAPDPSAAGYDFEGWYQDENCTAAFDFDSAITEDTTVYAKWVAFTYQFADSRTKVWQRNGSGTLSFKITRSAHDDWTYDRFESLVFDGKTLTRDTDYTVEPGSLIVTLRSSILNTKAVSTAGYTLKAIFSDGETATGAIIRVTAASATPAPTTKPTVTAAPTLNPSGQTGTSTRTGSTNTTPKTGDDSHIVTWSLIGLGSLAALAAVVVVLKKNGKKH